MRAGHELKTHRRNQRWANKSYEKTHLRNEWKRPIARTSHAKAIVLEDWCSYLQSLNTILNDIGELTGSGHDYNLMASFGDKLLDSKSPDHNYLHAMPFGGKITGCGPFGDRSHLGRKFAVRKMAEILAGHELITPRLCKALSRLKQSCSAVCQRRRGQFPSWHRASWLEAKEAERAVRIGSRQEGGANRRDERMRLFGWSSFNRNSSSSFVPVLWLKLRVGEIELSADGSSSGLVRGSAGTIKSYLRFRHKKHVKILFGRKEVTFKKIVEMIMFGSVIYEKMPWNTIY
ncbi:hypothetical protein IEQ34_016350 [Dendrobium chrysotoxum]|uniref:Uncharacterized protein n=1 Tax=Dendrobium chrysotoxum TaxID=161865 RepID=A0AAV7GD85_DENCH|nr:hypothetical protein IEQ34_016350 [Dendrobium chrysotoxum]